MADEEEENNDEEQDEKEIIERQIKTHKALQHMERELQLSTAIVMPVLLKLMKAYDGKWEFIEADNYHVLVDTIFASQESDDVEKAPGPSSAIGKKKRGKKPSTRGTPTRRAPRNSKRTESDDSDEPGGSQELVRRIRGRAPVARTTTTTTTTLARPIASCEPATPRATFACGDDDDGPAWEPLLALPAPLQTAPPQGQLELLPSAGGGRELQRISTGLPVRAELVTTMTELVSTMTAVSRETQTEASIFHPEAQAIQPTALICYEESVSEKVTTPVENKALVVKQEQEPLFLSDLEVRRQLLNHGALTSQICKQCDKPRAVRFDPSKVKVEGVQAPGSTKDREPPSMLCLNPAPLQALVPSPLPLPLPPPLPLPLPLPAGNSVSEDDMDCHVTDPEPLLLTFPTKTAPVKTETVAVGTSFAATEGLATHNTTSIRVQQMQRLVPCSKPPAMDTDCPSPLATTFPSVVKSAVEPASKVATAVENPVDIPSKAEVKEVLKTSSIVEEQEQEQELPDGAGCEALNVEGALAALASYSSDSDTSDAELEPALFLSSDHVEEVMHTSLCCPNANINHDKTNDSRGIYPLAIASQSNDATFLEPAHEVQTALKLAHEAQTASPRRQHEEATSEVAENSKDTEMVAASSETSKKRKRSLLELTELEEEQPRTDNNSGAERPSRHDHRDISRGKEKVAISVCKDGTTDVPPEFLYVNANVVYQNAHLGISMARIGEDDRCSGCAGDCLDNKVPCECTRLTDGEYAHSVEGCLYPHFLKQELERKRNLNLLSYCQPGACPVERTNDEVCKGHVQRRFIKECWEKCGCSQLCGNRVVQRGIVHRLQVFWTESGKGWGIRTLEPLRAGTFVCEYIGEILTNAEMWQRNNVHGKVKHHFSLQLDADWCSERYLKDEEALCLDGRRFGNVARFINHRCIDSNLIDIPVEIESPDHHYYHLAFFTSKDVNENEELTWDYGLDFNDKDHQVEAFECVCRSTFCRGKMEGRAS